MESEMKRIRHEAALGAIEAHWRRRKAAALALLIPPRGDESGEHQIRNR